MVWITLLHGEKYNIPYDVPYDVPYEYLEGSKVIEDIVDYIVPHDHNNSDYNYNKKTLVEQNLSSSSNPLPIPLSKYQWDSYVEFLQTGTPNSTALQVIDYLDNYYQAKQWLIAAYINSMSDDQILYNFSKTNYLVSDFTVDPIYTQGGNTVEQMLPYIQHLQPLPVNYIKYIVNRLFDNFTYTVYDQAAKYKYVNDIPTHIFKDLLKHGFIVTNLNKTQIKYDINELFSQNNIQNEIQSNVQNNIQNNFTLCSGLDRPALISPRVAEYYNNISEYGNRMWLCPDDKPYLSDEQTFDNGNNTYRRLCCSSKPTNIKQAIKVRNHSLLHRHWKQTYEPGISIRDYNKIYSLYTFNKPSSYGRDYYIYLVCEYDPHYRKLIAFSI